MLDFIDRTVIPFFLGLYDAVGYLGVAIAIALETFVPIIPSEVIVPMAGWKVSQSAADPSILEPLTNAPWSWLVVLIIATVGAVAGSLATKRVAPVGGGTFRTDTATFVVLLIGVIVIVGALTFFPALLLGPIVQGLTPQLF